MFTADRKCVERINESYAVAMAWKEIAGCGVGDGDGDADGDDGDDDDEGDWLPVVAWLLVLGLDGCQWLPG
ncbi:hypothetical protein N9L19_00190 [bacterium]|nr:hypothetical protein [bacterium]